MAHGCACDCPQVSWQWPFKSLLRRPAWWCPCTLPSPCPWSATSPWSTPCSPSGETWPHVVTKLIIPIIPIIVRPSPINRWQGTDLIVRKASGAPFVIFDFKYKTCLREVSWTWIFVRLHSQTSYLKMALPAIVFAIIFTLPTYFMLDNSCEKVNFTLAFGTWTRKTFLRAN